ncbi:MAG: iron-containing alcohol dehydrogenase [Candidatus Marinimicrobia bacterium]|nr:iron-containing alcohol dehydrogenase [Candidatus Neomarinimicrobiota bacterium]
MLQYNFPTTILFGENSLKDLPTLLKDRGLKNLLLVTDKGLVKAGVSKKVIKILSSKSITLDIFDEVHSNPIEEDVTKGVTAFKNGKYDGLIALGGGSAMDAAKTIRFMVTHEPPLAQYDDALGGDKKIVHPLPPLFAIPTTAGTGSEVGRSSVITLKETGKKTIFFHPGLMPDIVILDSTLTIGLPAGVTAATGMDAFTHCLEAYLVDSFHPMADAIAVSGMKLIFENLPQVIQDPENLDARGKMLLAATMGATAFQKGLGMIHSMAHPLSAKHGLHHGLANALLIPSSLEFTIQKSTDRKLKSLNDKLKNITEIISCNTLVDSDNLPYLLRGFINSTGINFGLENENISEDDIPQLAQLAVEDSCHLTHPFTITKEDFHHTLINAL